MRPTAILLSLSMASLMLTGCQKSSKDTAKPAEPQKTKAYTLADAPAELAPQVDKAKAAFGKLGSTLVGKLQGAMKAGGPGAAIDVCQSEAPEIARQIETELGFAVGRTSHKLRNPGNAAPYWAQDAVAKVQGGMAASHPGLVVDLGKSVGVLKPIGVMPICLNCHGAAKTLLPEVTAGLKKHYPADAATGFGPGDLRGFFWADVPK